MEEFYSERLIIRPSDVSMAEALADYYTRNRAFFVQYEPTFLDIFYTADYQRKSLENEMKNMENSASLYYYFYLKEDPDTIIGTISFSRLRKEPYRSTIFGYNLDEKMQGHGYCTEACKACIDHVLNNYNVHRIDARAMVTNEKSQKVLERLGFMKEGTERQSIRIGGKFRDHYTYGFINEDY